MAQNWKRYVKKTTTLFCLKFSPKNIYFTKKLSFFFFFFLNYFQKSLLGGLFDFQYDFDVKSLVPVDCQ